jgi:hypothetical protein
VAVRGIVFAAAHDRKEVLVRWPTVESVVGERVNSQLLDRYLAHAAWEGALEGPQKAGHPNHFWQPVDRDFGAHGRFDSQVRGSSVPFWANKYRGALAVVAAFAVAAMVAVFWKRA